MRSAIYARVSTADKNQEPETQLQPLRDFCTAQGFEVTGEFVDQASAADLRRRTAWRDLLDQAAKRKVDLVLVWRVDRAFRSVLDAANTLERFRGWGVGLRSYQEPWLDTTSPFGEALYYITVAYAQLERGIIQERVKAGMERARREGRHLGRPRVENRPGVQRDWPMVQRRIKSGEISRAEAARMLRISEASVRRLLGEPGAPR
jgi:DNA invertase Pin-like site-specific DNA recombinase